MYYKGPQIEKVYKAAITKKEKADTSLRWIFISDIYVVEKNGYYVNYFDENEKFYNVNKNKSQFLIEGNGVQLRAITEHRFDELGVISDMLFNPNYCKDRLMVMEKAIKKGLILNEEEQQRYMDVLDLDSKINDRYKIKIKQNK